MNMTPKQKTLVEYLHKGPEYELEIFKKLNGIQWFEFLYDLNYFSLDKNPKPVPSDTEGFFSIPYWPALKFIERVAKECGETNNIRAAEKIMTLIRDFSKSELAVDNYHTWHSFSKIFGMLPIEVITLGDIDLIPIWFESSFDNSLVGAELGKGLLPRLLNSHRDQDKDGAVKIIEIITRVKKSSDSKSHLDDLKLTVKPYWVREFFKRNARIIANSVGDKAIRVLEDKLNVFYRDDSRQHRWSYLRRAAIEDHEQNLGEDTAYFVLVSAIRDVAVIYTNERKDHALIERWVRSDYDIFNRLGLYVLSKNYLIYKDIFWTVFDRIERGFFENINLYHEAYSFLNECFSEFTLEQQMKIVRCVDELESGAKDGNEKYKYDASLRMRWLSSIRNQGNEQADKAYYKYREIIGKDPEHPDFLNWHGAWEPRPSFDPTIFKKITDSKEIIKFANSFDIKNDFGEIAYDELGEHIQARIKSEQTFFESILLELIPMKFAYHDFIIQGFKDIFLESKPVNWSLLFTYFNKLINEPRLWGSEQETKDRYDKRRWVPTSIAQLIESGIRNEINPIKSDDYAKCGEILAKILCHQPSSELEEEREDILTWAINTPRGRTLEAYFIYALRNIKTAGDDESLKRQRWAEVEPALNREIEILSEKENYEFLALSGRYLPNFYYMNKTWLESNMPTLFQNKNTSGDLRWKSALDGYSYVNTVYRVIYELLKQNGDFDKVISEVHDHHRIRERFIENVAVSYLRGDESLDEGSLFRKILDLWKSSDICDVIGLMWSCRKADLEESAKSRIYDFWNYCHKKLLGKEQENQEILSDINLLAVFFEDLTSPKKDWLLQSVPFVEKRYHSTFLVEYLEKLADKNPQEVGEIFLAMVKNTVSTYESENVISIVRKLYAGKQVRIANSICDTYDRAGHEFLRPVFEESRKNV